VSADPEGGWFEPQGPGVLIIDTLPPEPAPEELEVIAAADEQVLHEVDVGDDDGAHSQASGGPLPLPVSELFSTNLAADALPIVAGDPHHPVPEPEETPEFARAFDEYLEVLRELCQLGVSTAGYVDRPKGDLVVRLLELALVPDEALRQVGKERPLAGITDEMLFNAILMNPGERSAVFAIQSISAHHFTGDLALHFFYLNVGLPGAPYLARVETPAWVIQDPLLLASLHATLIAQCRILGRRAFPYALHRAHEVAVVTYEDKNKLAEMILAELNRQGIVADKSHKQSSKDLPGRTRHEL